MATRFGMRRGNPESKCELPATRLGGLCTVIEACHAFAPHLLRDCLPSCCAHAGLYCTDKAIGDVDWQGLDHG